MGLSITGCIVQFGEIEAYGKQPAISEYPSLPQDIDVLPFRF
jgi:hypothetical protein